MFDGITVSAIMTEAGTFATAIASVLLIVIGFGVLMTLSNWVISKFRGR